MHGVWPTFCEAFGTQGPTSPKGVGAPYAPPPRSPRGYVHGGVLRNLEALVTPNPFGTFTMWSERATEKSSHPIHLILDCLHIELSY